LTHAKGWGAALLVLTLPCCRATPNPSNEAGGLQKQRAGLETRADPAAPPPSTPTAPTAQPPAPPASLPMIAIQPLLNLQRDIVHCSYDIYVNGGLVERNNEALPTSGTQPLNHWLRSGENEVAVYMYKWPDEPDECDVSVSLELRDASLAQQPPVTLMTLVHKAKQAPPGDPARGSSPAGALDSHRAFQSSAQGDVRVGPAEVVQLTGAEQMVHVLRRNITLGLPFPEWAFFRSDRLKTFAEVESTQELLPDYYALHAAYDQLWALLDKQDVDGFADACDERSRELDRAYYKQPGDTRAGLRQHLISTMKNSELELNTLTLTPDKFFLRVTGSRGQVHALVEDNVGTPILRYPRKDGGAFSIIFPIMFRREKGRYIVTR
jgi:hypothetical protein